MAARAMTAEEVVRHRKALGTMLCKQAVGKSYKGGSQSQAIYILSTWRTLLEPSSKEYVLLCAHLVSWRDATHTGDGTWPGVSKI